MATILKATFVLTIFAVTKADGGATDATCVRIEP